MQSQLIDGSFEKEEKRTTDKNGNTLHITRFTLFMDDGSNPVPKERATRYRSTEVDQHRNIREEIGIIEWTLLKMYVKVILTLLQTQVNFSYNLKPQRFKGVSYG